MTGANPEPRPGGSESDPVGVAESLRVVATALRGLASEDDGFRAAIGRLGAWLSGLADQDSSASKVVSQPPEVQTRDHLGARDGDTRGTAPLRIGDSMVPVEVTGTPQELDRARQASIQSRPSEPTRPPAPSAAPDLRLVQRRCQLKAECCRWANTRRRRIDEGAPWDTAIKPTDEELVRQARELPDCYAWTLNPYTALPDEAALEDMASAYENLGAIAETVADLSANADEMELFRQETYELLAEAQSALRKSLIDAEVKRDQDQDDAFGWLRHRTFEDQVFIARHMRLDDPADPGNWADLQRRIADLRDRIEGRRAGERTRRNLIGKVRYICRHLPDRSPKEARREWTTLAEVVEDLIGHGMAPSDRELRDLLMPVCETMPADLSASPGIDSVLDSIDRHQAAREAARQPTTDKPRPASPEVEQAAKLLEGRVVVLIGGEQRPHSKRALERDLRLTELKWIATSPHDSVSRFESQIARPEVALVMLAIRWSSHSFEAVKEMCQRYGKPYVRLPAGYGSNRVAAEILSQVSDRLDGSE